MKNGNSKFQNKTDSNLVISSEPCFDSISDIVTLYKNKNKLTAYFVFVENLRKFHKQY